MGIMHIYNCNLEFAAFVICVVMYLFIKTKYTPTKTIIPFARLTFTTIMVIVFHIAVAYISEYASFFPLWLSFLVNSIFFLACQENVFSFFKFAISYIDDERYLGRCTRAHLRIFVISTILLIINSFKPFIFYYDLSNADSITYGPGSFFCFLIPAHYIVSTLYIVVKNWKNYSKGQYLAVLIYSLFYIGGLFAQSLISPHYYFIFFWNTVALLIILFSLETPDFVALQRTMDELEIAKEEAESATVAKSMFLARMSHEIRTPLNAILGLDEMIIRESMDNEIKEYALDIRNSGQNLLGLINDILDFSKIESGKFERFDTDYDVVELILDLKTLMQGKAKAKQLGLFVNVDPEMPRFLRGDEKRIRQIVVNLVSNAIKYTKCGHVTVSISFKALEDKQNILVKVAVADTGVGIAKEDIETIFKPFERTREVKIEGTGLGISISQQLLELMNSKLELESEPGVGSTFSFELEQRVVDWTCIGDYEQANHVSDEAEAFKESFTAKDAQILVVDDVPINLTVVKGLLKNTHMQMETATSGALAIDMCKNKAYNLILLDHMMPEMDGVETLNHIKGDEDSLNKKTPIVALTANAISGAKEFYHAQGFDYYISKPFNPANLERVVLRYLPIDMIHEADTKENAQEIPDVVSRLAKIPELNTEAGIVASGTPQIYAQVAEEFYNTIDSRIQMLEDYLKKQDVENFTIQIHGLKTTARLLGYAKLSELAKELEEHGKNGEVSFIKEKAPEALKMYKGIKAPLEEIFETQDEQNKPVISDEQFSEAMKTIRMCEEKFDTELAEMVFEQLLSYEIPDKYKPLYKKLKSLLADVARDEIIKLLSDGKY